LERSHLTDDREFYIPRAFQLTCPQRLLDEATGYLYYCATLLEHASLDYRAPFQTLKTAFLTSMTVSASWSLSCWTASQ